MFAFSAHKVRSSSPRNLLRKWRRPSPGGVRSCATGKLRFEPLEARTLLALTSLIDATTQARAFVPTQTEFDDLGLDWTGSVEPFDDSAWAQTPVGGPNGAGYSTSANPTDYTPYAGVDLEAEMHGTSLTAFVRIPFSVSDAGSIDTLTLKMRFDKGFIAYLNGTEIQRANAPAAAYPAWNARASGSATAGSSYTTYDVSANTSLLNDGANVLAIRGFNLLPTSTSFLVQAALDADGADQPPIANDDSVSYRGDLTPSATVNVLANDVPGTLPIAPASVEVVSPPANGTAAVNPISGAITYTHNTGFTGTDSFTYRVRSTATPVPPATVVDPNTAPHRTLVPTNGNLGLTWTGGNEPFDDSAWVAGVGGIGYDRDAATDFTPFINDDVGARTDGINSVVYERIPFTVDPATTTGMRLRLRYDDGFIAYMNGVEVARMHAPVIPTWNSVAPTQNGDAASILQQEFIVNLSSLSLRSGNNTNILAIATYNQAATSSDLLMQAELIADQSVALVSNEATVSVTVQGPGPVAFDDAAETTGRTPVVIPVLDNDVPGSSGQPIRPESVRVTQAPANGTTAVDLATGAITYQANPGFSGQDALQYTVHDAAMVGGTQTSLILPRQSTWKYLADSIDPGNTNWRNPGFDDSSWSSGPGILGYGNILSPPYQATTIPEARPTVLFRNTFSLTSDDVSELKIRLVRDDGAAVFINGVEVRRDNLAPNASWSDYANGGAVGGADESTYFETTLSAAELQSRGVPLNVGTNTVAVEVHQDNAGSSDISFDLELEATLATPTGYVSNPATVTITVAPTDDPPTANDDDVLTKIEQPIDVEVLANDEPGGAPFDLATLAVLAGPTSGTIDVLADGRVRYTPAAAFTGDDGFTYTITDTAGRTSNVATVSIQVVTSVPMPADDLYFVDEDDVLNVPAAFGLLANDTDDGGQLVSTVVAQPPEHGTLQLAADGGFQYVPATNFYGDDHFRYRATDDFGESAEADVTIRVLPSADAPIALGDVFATPMGTPLVVVATTVSQQIVVPAGSQWRYLDDGSNPGSAWRQVDFDDSEWSAGVAQFGYGDGDEATLVRYGDDFNNRHITTYFRRDFNVVDPAGVHALQIGLLRDDGGAVYLNGTRVVLSNLPSSFNGTTPAENSVAGDEENAFLPFDVNPSVLTPGRNVIAVEVHQSSPQSNDMSFDLFLRGDVAAPVSDGVLANDVDPDGDSLTAVLVSPPSHGSLIFSADGGFAYSPNAGFAGADTFTYRASDGERQSAVTTVVINVTPPPSMAADLNEDGVVNEADVAMVVAGLGMAGGAEKYGGDANGDGIVDVKDVAAVQRAFGAAMNEAAAAPSALIAGRRDAQAAIGVAGDAAAAHDARQPIVVRAARRPTATIPNRGERPALSATSVDRALGGTSAEPLSARQSLRAARRR